jgi:NCS1 family nucleobase:cation symporter-1
VVAIIGTLIAIEASSNFLHDLSNFLVFTLYLLVPWTAINLTDFYLIRHGKYNIPELFKVDGIYGKFNWFALIVYVLAVGVQFPFMNNEWIVGPVANALGGADIAWIVGFVFAAVVYYVGVRYFMPSSARTGGDRVLVPGKSGGTPAA